MKNSCIGLMCLLISACQPGTGEFLTDDSENNVEVKGLAEIQQKIFTPICSQCHVGSAAPLGLRLDSTTEAFNNLVNVTAVGNMNFQRVKPFDADNSFIMLKILGDPIAGQRMPLGLTPLTELQIDLIRRWINEGAPPVVANNLVSLKTQSVSVDDTSIQLTIALINNQQPVEFFEGSVLVYQIIDNTPLLLTTDEIQVQTETRQLTINIDKRSLIADSVKIIIGEDTLFPLLDKNGSLFDFNNNNMAGGTYELIIQVD